MIKIISGTAGTSKGVKTPRDPAFTLPAKEESRLVFRGVAEYVHKAAPEPVPAAEESAAEELAEETAEEPEIDLTALTLAQLKELAADLQIDTAGLKTKASYIAAIEDASEVPDLGVESPEL